MNIGILQTGQIPDKMRPRLGDYPQLFAHFLDGHGFGFRTWKVQDMAFPASVHDADGWLITGSCHGVYENHPFIAPLEQLVRDALVARVPLVGICFGHQLMAQALGGTVRKFPGGWAIGPQTYALDGQRLRLNAWHQDQVITPPTGARVIASNDFCPYAGLAYGDLGWSVQAHPEFPDAVIEGLLNLPSAVPQPQRAAAQAALGRPLDSATVGRKIARVFRRAPADAP